MSCFMLLLTWEGIIFVSNLHPAIYFDFNRAFALILQINAAL